MLKIYMFQYYLQIHGHKNKIFPIQSSVQIKLVKSLKCYKEYTTIKMLMIS